MSQNKKLNFQESNKQMPEEFKPVALMEKKELEELKTATLMEKKELEELKVASGESWEESSQKELDLITAKLAAIDEAIALKAITPSTYSPPKGTEKMVHLSLVKGRRFNPNTGKEESKAFIQYFTYPEWRLFKSHYRRLGYTVAAVLHDPYGETEEIATK